MFGRIASENPQPGFAAKLRRLDEVEHDDIHGDRAREPIGSRGIEHRHDQNEIGNGGAEDCQQDKGEDELRNCHQDVDRARHHLVHPAAGQRCRGAKGDADRESKQRGRERDRERVPRAIDQPAEDVAPELVGAEQELPAPRQEWLARDDFGLAVGREKRGENCRDDVDQDYDQGRPGDDGGP